MSAGEPKKYQHPRMILCEGPEDVSFFAALINEHNLSHFHIDHTGKGRQERGGNSRFFEKLRALQVNSSFRKTITRLLIVTDSDDDLDRSFNAVADQIEKANFQRPTKPMELTGNHLKIGIMMIPRDGIGNLECLLQGAARSQDHKISSLVDNFVTLVGGDKWPIPKQGKLWLRVLIAARWKKDPFINLAPLFGEVRSRDLIPLKDPSFEYIATFLKSIS